MNAILAMTKDGGIGINGLLPWRSKADMEFFKHMTEGSTVIMGRKTFDSLSGRPLPKRNNIVLTRNFTEDKEQTRLRHKVKIITSPEELTPEDKQQCFVIGGSEIYKLFADQIDTYFITEMKRDYICDTFFDKSVLDNLNSFVVEDNDEFSVTVYSTKPLTE